MGEEEDSRLEDFIEDKEVVLLRMQPSAPAWQARFKRVLSRSANGKSRFLRMRFGIGEKHDHTLEEVGQDFNVTRNGSGRLR